MHGNLLLSAKSSPPLQINHAYFPISCHGTPMIHSPSSTRIRQSANSILLLTARDLVARGLQARFACFGFWHDCPRIAAKTQNRSVSNPRPKSPTSQTKLSGNQSRYDLYRTSRPSFVFLQTFLLFGSTVPRGVTLGTPPPWLVELKSVA